MGELSELTLYISKGSPISSLRAGTLNIEYTPAVNPFCLPPPTDHTKEEVGAVNTSAPAGRENPPTKEPPTDNKGRW